MSSIKGFLAGKKTYISGGLLVAVCVATFFGIDVVPGITADNAASTAWQAVIAMCIRAGVAKV